MKHRRGFSLAELVTYMAIIGVFILGLYVTFHLGYDVFLHTQGKSDVVHAGENSETFLNRTLATGANASVAVQTGPAAIKFCSAMTDEINFEYDPNGALLWQRWFCVYHDPAQEALMAAEKRITPTADLTAAISAAPTFATMLSLSPRIVTPNVKSVTFSMLGTVVRYDIITEIVPSIPNAKPTRLAVSGNFSMRN